MQSPKRKQEGVRASNSAPLNFEIQEVDSFTLLEDKILVSARWNGVWAIIHQKYIIRP